MLSNTEERLSVLVRDFEYSVIECGDWQTKNYLKKVISGRLKKTGEPQTVINTFIDLMYLLGEPWNYLK